MRLLSLRNILILLVLGCGILLSAQYSVPQKPDILYPIYDEVGLLSTDEKENLNQKLIKFEDSTSTEIEVIIIKSTLGEDINFLATKFGQEWGIGKNKVDNGVVFLIATEDRTLSIQQGRAVEQYLTASVSGQIIDYLIVPHFRKGDWYKGIDVGTNAIIEAVQGKFKPKKSEKEEFPVGFAIVLIIVMIIFIIIAYKNNGNGSSGGGYFDDDVVISRRGRRNYPGGFHTFPNFGGSGSGGFSGGGFGGFGGGGSFGGGGASGSW